jgi:hypothetical protein
MLLTTTLFKVTAPSVTTGEVPKPMPLTVRVVPSADSLADVTTGIVFWASTAGGIMPTKTAQVSNTKAKQTFFIVYLNFCFF